MKTLFFPAEKPSVQRIRHELTKRTLTVSSSEFLTPHMIRITLTGSELSGFISLSPDDHIKIVVPDNDGVLTRRDYTPRRYNPQNGSLVLDFVNHDGGPAATWTRNTKAGDQLEIAGPRGSQIITGDIKHWLLIGDETALPSIGRRVEELTEQQTATTLVAVPTHQDEQNFTTGSTYTSHWIHRPINQADNPDGFLSLLHNINIPDNTFVWIGAEAHVTKTIRNYLIDERKVSVKWIKASGYWVKGNAGTSVKDVGDKQTLT